MRMKWVKSEVHHDIKTVGNEGHAMFRPMRSKGFVLLMVIVLSMLVLSACGGDNPSDPPGKSGSEGTNQGELQGGSNPDSTGSNTPPAKVDPPKPVELVFYGVSILNDEIMNDLSSYVQRKLPHVTLKYLNNQGDHTLANVVTTGTQIDLMFGSFAGFGNVEQLGLLGDDLDDQIKKHQFDLSRIDEAYINLFRGVNQGKLSGLPFYDLRRVMYYNMDVFDKFAIDYPKDHMTWEETAEIARKLTKEDGGIQYRGFSFNPTGFIPTNQYSTPLLDPKTNKASLNNDQWKTVLESIIPLYNAPGYGATKDLLNKESINLFMKDQTAGMFLNFNSDARAVSEAGFNWDAVTFPEVSSLPGVGSQPYPVYVAISSIVRPEHRDAAFQVLELLLSDEIQLERSVQRALATPLKSEEIKRMFARDVEVWQGKNIYAVTAQKPAEAIPFSPYNRFAQSAISNALLSVIVNEMDVNSALREAEEIANKAIEEAMTAQ